MTTGKFKLSETIKFFSSQLQALSGQSPLKLTIELDDAQVRAGQRLTARVVLHNPERQRTLNYLVLHMEGTVQRDDKWRPYTETAEVGQNMVVGTNQALIFPVQLYIPEDAVLTEDGAAWSLSVRAVLDKALDPREQLDFSVIEPEEGQPDGRWFSDAPDGEEGEEE